MQLVNLRYPVVFSLVKTTSRCVNIKAFAALYINTNVDVAQTCLETSSKRLPPAEDMFTKYLS